MSPNPFAPCRVILDANGQSRNRDRSAVLRADAIQQRGAENSGVENAGVENTGVKNVTRRRTQALYVKVFEKVSALVAQFAASCAVADFHEASVSAFRHVFQDAVVVGCWFHYAQAVMNEKMQQDWSERIVWT